LRFPCKAIAFARVTWDARANDIFPSGCSATVARNDVIEIQVITIERDAAVLAGVLVALENIVPGEFYFLLWKPIEKEQHDHPGHTDLPGDRLDQLVIGRVAREIAPALKIVGQEIIRVVRGDDMGVAGVNEREGAA